MARGSQTEFILSDRTSRQRLGLRSRNEVQLPLSWRPGESETTGWHSPPRNVPNPPPIHPRMFVESCAPPERRGGTFTHGRRAFPHFADLAKSPGTLLLPISVPRVPARAFRLARDLTNLDRPIGDSSRSINRTPSGYTDARNGSGVRDSRNARIEELKPGDEEASPHR
jgi:hypothetical protein